MSALSTRSSAGTGRSWRCCSSAARRPTRTPSTTPASIRHGAAGGAVPARLRGPRQPQARLRGRGRPALASRPGVDVDGHRCLQHAIARGRGPAILTILLDAGADPNLRWDRWAVGRRPLALAARCGHLAAYELLRARGATAPLDAVDSTVLAVARGESTTLPAAPPPALGNPEGEDYGWILRQFALLGRTDVVRAPLDAGMAVDTPGWSNFTPLDQAVMHGRELSVRLLIKRGADLHDCAFDDDGPTPLDCALWGLRNHCAEDGDYAATVQALLEADAPARHLADRRGGRRRAARAARTPARGRRCRRAARRMGSADAAPRRRAARRQGAPRLDPRRPASDAAGPEERRGRHARPLHPGDDGGA